MWDHLQVIEKLENEEGHRKKKLVISPPNLMKSINIYI